MTAPDHMLELFKTHLHYRGHPHMSLRGRLKALFLAGVVALFSLIAHAEVPATLPVSAEVIFDTFPSGGLLAKGHPLGATGVAQMVEVAWQLEGCADGRQVEGPRVGLTQCTGGGIAGVDHAASAVHVLGV